MHRAGCYFLKEWEFADFACAMLSSIGAIPWFSEAERSFLMGSESPWVNGAASRGSRKEELVERNASVALKTAVTEIRDSEQHGRSVGAGAGSHVVISPRSYPLEPWV